MKSQIVHATKADVYELIQFYGRDKFTVEQAAFFRKCVATASSVWTGFIDGELVCFWGLIPPTLLADNAYLWLYTTEALTGNEFVFVRQSQIALRKMQESYPTIIGHVRAGNDHAIKWLRWLGAEFAEPQGIMIPFAIRRK